MTINSNTEISATVDNHPWFPKTPPSILVTIGEDSRGESYKTLFVDGNYGAVSDIFGFDHISEEQLKRLDAEIDECRENLLKAIIDFADNLLSMREEGEFTEESVETHQRYLESQGVELDDLYANGIAR